MRERVARVVAWSLVPAYVVTWVWQLLLEGSAYGSDGLGDSLLAVGFGAAVVVAAVLMARRPDHVVTWLLAFVAIVITVGPPLETYAEARIRTVGAPDGLATVGLWLNGWYWLPALAVVLVLVPLVFPDGRWPDPRWRWFGWTVVALWGVIAVSGMVAGTIETQERPYRDLSALPAVFTCEPDEVDPSVSWCESTWDNPVGIGTLDPEEGPTAVLVAPALLLGLGGAITSIVVRFRRSRGVERQQMKWLLWATALLPLPIVFESVPVVGDLGLPIALAAVPTAIGVAILRYRLWDIDRVVSRTVTYAVVTALLAGTYVGLVLALQALAGPADASDLVVAGSTLVVAALFRPVRDGVQRVVDRRFDRARFDHDRILGDFAARLRDQVDRDAVERDLRGTLQRAFAPAGVSLWLPTRSP